MSNIIPVSIILLSALVHSLLQLSLGCLLLLYHSSLGQHIKKRTKSLVSNYIFGIGLMVFLSISATCYIITSLFNSALTPTAFTIIFILLILLSIFIWLFYYRKSSGTELWLPRPISAFISERAKTTNKRTEAFLLGSLATLAELPLTIVLTFLAANSILELPSDTQLLLVIIYTIIVILPLIITRLFIRKGKTIVDVQRWRTNNKQFLKFICGLGFIILAFFVLTFKLIGEKL